MRILFDQGTPVPLKKYLSDHQVSTVYELGWSTMKNGDLLREAERNGFEIFITTDKNIRFQQSLSDKNLAVLVLPFASWPKLQKHISLITESVSSLKSGDIVELTLR